MSLPPLISLEEHFFTTPLPPALLDLYSQQLSHIPSVLTKLTDLSPTSRIPDMDSGQISLQVISHAPGLGSFPPEYSIQANDQLAAAIKSHPTRFAGLAVLPVSDPQSAAQELERAIKTLGLRGALIDSHTAEGKFFDGPEYDVLWGKAADLDVPVYLHPTWPPSPPSSSVPSSSVPSSSSAVFSTTLYQGNYPESASKSLGSSAFGWHSVTGLHFLRLFASGLFDRHPTLKVVLGHMGEMLPFMLKRVEALSGRWGNFERGFRRVWDENVWITTSGVWGLDPLRCVLSEGNTRAERVLYGVDYPFQRNEVGLEFMRELERSGLVDREGLEKIAHRNAEALLGVRVTVVKGN